MPLSFWPLFDPSGQAINAASVLPGLLCGFGDMDAILDAMAPRKILAAASRGNLVRDVASVRQTNHPFAKDAAVLIDWLLG